MVAKLSTTINKIQALLNSSNSKILNGFLTYMKNNGLSERHQNKKIWIIYMFFYQYTECCSTNFIWNYI